MKHDATQLARSPLLLLELARRRGLDRDELMHEAGLTIDDLADPDCRIPVAVMRKLWLAVMKRDDDPTLGLQIGAIAEARRLGLVGYVMLFSADLHQALTDLSRYSKLLSDAIQFHVQPAGETVALRVVLRSYMLALRHPLTATLSVVLSVSREITGEALVPTKVLLPLPRPQCEADFLSEFGPGLRFESNVAEMHFTPQQMRLPVVSRDPSLGGYLDELADAKLRELGEDEAHLIDRVRRQIWATLQHGKPSLNDTAARLNMSPRTLQRRLGELGTSFKNVLEELRRELSDELRAGQGYGASEVAFLLGYSEPSAYQRATRRWRRLAQDQQRAS